MFAGNAGDNIRVTFSATTGSSNAPAAYDGVVLYEVNDGVVSIGDQVNVTNFSINQFGSGVDLVIQHQPFNPDPTGSYAFSSAQSQTINLNLASTGQYAIGVSCMNELCVAGSTFTVSLIGNTGSLSSVVPEPATLAHMILGLAGIGLRKYRHLPGLYPSRC